MIDRDQIAQVHIDRIAVMDALAEWGREDVAATLLAVFDAYTDPDTLIISKVDGEWPEEVVEAVTNGIHGPPYNVGSVDSKCRVLAFAALDALLEQSNS